MNANNALLKTRFEILAAEKLPTVFDLTQDIHILEDEAPVIRRVFIEHKPEVLQRISDLTAFTYQHFHHSDFGLIEPDVKHEGIEALMKAVDGNLDDVVVFGDGMNDVKMFEAFRLSIAMGNAVEPLKQIASEVTERSDNDGIYQACLRHGWIEAIA